MVSIIQTLSPPKINPGGLQRGEKRCALYSDLFSKDDFALIDRLVNVNPYHAVKIRVDQTFIG